MTELTKRQEYIKEKYFELEGGFNPVYYRFVCDKMLVLAPFTMYKLIDIIIKILENENEGEMNWVKIT